jgi:Rrf2 family protein
MLALTRKTDYALIALTHLAQEAGGCISAREIATRYRIPLPLLMNILKVLTNQGLARSARGPRGGYSLALPPDRITLNDVIRAVEGPVQLVQCVVHDGAERDARGDCELTGCCPVRRPIQRIHERLVQFLDDVTLAEITNPAACGCSSRTSATRGDAEGETVHLSR